MNQAELKVTVQALRQQLQTFERITVCCLTCEHYADSVKQCSVHQASPPEAWRQGPIECPSWEYDNVPF